MRAACLSFGRRSAIVVPRIFEKVTAGSFPTPYHPAADLAVAHDSQRQAEGRVSEMSIHRPVDGRGPCAMRIGRTGGGLLVYGFANQVPPYGGRCSMRKWHGILAAVALGLVPAVALVGTTHARSSASSDENDFALFTTEDVNRDGISDDDKVVCMATPKDPLKPRPAFNLHISVVNFDPDEHRLVIRFADGDLVTYAVPTGTSFSISQVAGTTPGVDDRIEIDPQDNDGDGLGMAGWVSAEEAESGKVEEVVCKTVPTMTTP